MAKDFVILCAAGMLVTVYLMVGQKALVVAIRLYGVQSFLLGAVGIALGLSEHRPHLLVTAGLTIALKTVLIPWFLLRVIDRTGIRREIEPYVNVPASLLLSLGLLLPIHLLLKRRYAEQLAAGDLEVWPFIRRADAERTVAATARS